MGRGHHDTLISDWGTLVPTTPEASTSINTTTMACSNISHLLSAGRKEVAGEMTEKLSSTCRFQLERLATRPGEATAGVEVQQYHALKPQHLFGTRYIKPLAEMEEVQLLPAEEEVLALLQEQHADRKESNGSWTGAVCDSDDHQTTLLPDEAVEIQQENHKRAAELIELKQELSTVKQEATASAAKPILLTNQNDNLQRKLVNQAEEGRDEQLQSLTDIVQSLQEEAEKMKLAKSSLEEELTKLSVAHKLTLEKLHLADQQRLASVKQEQLTAAAHTRELNALLDLEQNQRREAASIAQVGVAFGRWRVRCLQRGTMLLSDRLEECQQTVASLEGQHPTDQKEYQLELVEYDELPSETTEDGEADDLFDLGISADDSLSEEEAGESSGLDLSAEEASLADEEISGQRDLCSSVRGSTWARMRLIEDQVAAAAVHAAVGGDSVPAADCSVGLFPDHRSSFHEVVEISDRDASSESAERESWSDQDDSSNCSDIEQHLEDDSFDCWWAADGGDGDNYSLYEPSGSASSDELDESGSLAVTGDLNPEGSFKSDWRRKLQNARVQSLCDAQSRRTVVVCVCGSNLSRRLVAPAFGPFLCDVCNLRVPTGQVFVGCKECDYHVCRDCYRYPCTAAQVQSTVIPHARQRCAYVSRWGSQRTPRPCVVRF